MKVFLFVIKFWVFLVLSAKKTADLNIFLIIVLIIKIKTSFTQSMITVLSLLFTAKLFGKHYNFLGILLGENVVERVAFA